MRNVLKQIFVLMSLLEATFSIWDKVDFVFDIHRAESFANLIKTLTSEARVLNLEHGGYRG